MRVSFGLGLSGGETFMLRQNEKPGEERFDMRAHGLVPQLPHWPRAHARERLLRVMNHEKPAGLAVGCGDPPCSGLMIARCAAPGHPDREPVCVRMHVHGRRADCRLAGRRAWRGRMATKPRE